MMDTQIANFLSRFVDQYETLIDVLQDVQDVNQEAFDRSYDAELVTLDYSTLGDLAYLDYDKLLAAFAAWTAIQATLDASSRQNWSRLYEVRR